MKTLESFLNSARTGVAAFAFGLVAFLAACAGPETGPLPDREAGLLPSGAADGFATLPAIPIVAGETVEGQAGGTAFTLYQLELGRGSTIQAQVEQTSGDLAPMAFLYEELDDLAREDGFLSPIGYDYDDSSLTIEWSNAEGGTHFILVAAYGETSGSFSLTVSVIEVPTGPPLTDDEEDQVARSLDNICPDTFCAGDMNYRVDSLDCDGAGRCEVGMRARYYYEEDAFAADVLEGRAESELAASGPCEEGGVYEARLTDTDGDEDGVWIVTSCALVGELYTFEDIAETSYSGVRYSERLYTMVLDCADAIESLLSTL